MAGDSGFNGNRYLLDANDLRQYVVPFVHGQPRPNIQVVSGDARAASKFKPNETVFAFDEPQEQVFKRSGTGAVMETNLYQIDIKADGTPGGLLYAPVTYDVAVEKSLSGGARLVYTLTVESFQDLQSRGFSAKVPAFLEKDLDDSMLSADVLDLTNILPFPPQHENGSFAARANADIIVPAQPVTPPARNNAPVVKRPTPSFNNRPAQQPVRPKSYRTPDSAIEAIIKQYCKDYTELAAEGKLDPVVGRGAETDQALKVLTRRKQSSLCFTGEAGVGKSAMFSAVAQRIVDDPNLPETLKGARILELDLQAMNAGAKFRGQFEEKLKPLIDGLQEREGMLKGRKIILAIDEIHSQLTAGKAEGGTDSGNMMKPFLTGKGISVMGTTTDTEYKQVIEKDGALASRFEKLALLPPNEADTVTILKTLWPLTKAHNNLTKDLTDEEFAYIATMTNRYAPQEAQPRKSEKVMNMAAASAEFAGRSEINRDDIIAAVAQMSNLPVDFLNQSDHQRFLKLEEDLPKEVLGQPGLQRVVDGLIGSRSGLSDENQPWGCFVFQGPTGTGKTEACKALARHLFGSEDALIKLDMSEFSEKHTVSRLIGAPPGFVGFEDSEPALTEKVRKRPYSILLLDEIEKAHPDVFNVLLPLLNDGKMTDNHGKTVLFNNVIVVMTTNAGAQVAMKLIQSGGKGSGIGFGDDKQMSQDDMMEKLADVYKKAVKMPQGEGRPALFRPEMINRIEELGGFITFLPLDKKVVANLVTREVAKINKRLSSQAGANVKGLSVEVTKEVEAELSKLGYDPAMGARPLRKVVREKVSNPFGKWLMGNKEKVLAFIAQHGAAKVVISSLEKGADLQLVAVEAAPAVAASSNDNAGKLKLPKLKPTTPKVGG